MIALEPFTAKDFETFKSWIDNVEELFQFAGPLFSFPITNDQLEEYLTMDDRKPMKVVLIETNETIGHCEFNFENEMPRLCRVLVVKRELRGQKIGEQIIRKMVEIVFQDQNILAVDLNVFEWNKAAISCYEKVGFKIIKQNTDEKSVNGKIWKRLNMILKRNEINGS